MEIRRWWKPTDRLSTVIMLHFPLNTVTFELKVYVSGRRDIILDVKNNVYTCMCAYSCISILGSSYRRVIRDRSLQWAIY